MKKVLSIILLLFSITIIAQSTTTVSNKLKLKSTPNLTVPADSLMTKDSDGILSTIGIDEISAQFNISGLESIDEGNGFGRRIIGRNALFYDAIGLDATDFSKSLSFDTGKGSSGQYSTSWGEDIINQGYAGLSGGFGNTLSPSSTYGVAIGENVTIDGFSNQGFGKNIDLTGTYNFSALLDNQITGNFNSVIGTNNVITADQSGIYGENSINTADFTRSIGTNLFARSFGQISVGHYNTDFTPNSTTDFDDGDRAFNVGVGEFGLPADGMIIFNDGTTTFPSLDISEIVDPKSGITLEYFESRLPSTLSTGVTTGGVVTINAGDDTKIDISAGTGFIENWSNPAVPTFTKYSWTEQIGLDLPDISAAFTNVFMVPSATPNIAEPLLESGIEITPESSRIRISLQAALHLNGVSIGAIANSSTPSYQKINAVLDYIYDLGTINTANNYNESGANLEIDKTTGQSVLPFINRVNSLTNPTELTNPSISTVNLVREYRDGVGGFTFSISTDVDPDFWDDGTGTLNSVSNNQFTIQRFYFFGQTNTTILTYGQAEYSSLSDAEGKIFLEAPEIDDIMQGATFTTALIIQEGVTNITSAVAGGTAKFVNISSAFSSGGGGQVGNFVTTDTNQDISALKTYLTDLPESSITPTTDDQFANKKYVDDNSGGGGGGGESIHLPYFVSEAGNDIEIAVTNIEALNLGDGKQRVLVLDENVSIIGTPRIVTIPKEIPLFVRRDITITTNFVTRNIITDTSPISGTVADNYMQLQINGIFTADRDSKVFVGDGLIWFGEKSVQEIYADWFGIIYDSQVTLDQTANVRSLQIAVNCIVLDKSGIRATSKLKLNNGNIYLNSPVVSFASSMDEHPFLTGERNNGTVSATIIKIEGSESIKHEINYGETTNIFYTSKWGAPFIFQGLRNSSISKLRISGDNIFANRDSEWLPAGFGGAANNQTMAKIALRPDDFESGVVANIAWIESDVDWTIGRPYCAIITDPFRTAVASGGYNITDVPTSTIDLYYGTSQVSHQNSWAVNMSDMHIEKFVEGICQTLTGQQGDTYVYKNIMFQLQPIGISTVQDQSRDNKAYEIMAYDQIWAGFDNVIHGNGIMPEVQSFHSSGGIKYIHFGGQGNGILKFDSVISELTYAFGASDNTGELYDGNGVARTIKDSRSVVQFPASINNSMVKISHDNSYTTSEGTNYLLRPATISGFTINNSLIGPFTSDSNLAKRVFQPFQFCTLNGMTTGALTDFKFPIDMGWFYNAPKSTLARERKVGPSLNIQEDTVLQNNTNLYGTTGEAVSLLKTGRKQAFQNKNYNIEEVIYYRQLSNGDITVFEDRGFITIEYTDAPFDFGDLIYINRLNKIVLGVVIANTGSVLTVTNISKFEMATMVGQMDGNDQILGAKLFKLYFNKSHAPFIGTKGATTSEITIEDYAAIGDNDTDTSPMVKNTAIRMPNGNIYYVDDFSGGVAFLDRNYNEALSYDWVEPFNPNFETIMFVKRGASSGKFIQSSYYYRGQKYPYFSGENTKDINKEYVLCVKSGDFFEARTGNDVRAAMKANFIRYDTNDNPIEYIDGENTIFPITTIVTIPFNTTGTTANRPDVLGIPDEHIPKGYMYEDTTTVTSLWWNGSGWVTL